MKMEISKLLAGLLICAGLMACSPEKSENEKTAEGKNGSTNELVIANTDANALPSQEEDFSEETKAKLKKLREEVAILKVEAELKTANEQLNDAKVKELESVRRSRSTIYYSSWEPDEDYKDKTEAFSLTKQDLLNRMDGLGFEDPKIREGLSKAFDDSAGSDEKLDKDDVSNFRVKAVEVLKTNMLVSIATRKVNVITHDIN